MLESVEGGGGGGAQPFDERAHVGLYYVLFLCFAVVVGYVKRLFVVVLLL